MKINKRRPAFEYKLVSDTDDIFSSIFEKTPVAIILLSWPTKKILKANQAALSLLKVKTIDLILKNYLKLFDRVSDEVFGKTDFFTIEVKLRSVARGDIYLTVKGRKFNKTQVILTLEDITPHKKSEKKLLKLAQVDGLTGILNHKVLMQRLYEELSRAKRYHLPLSCFMFDIDDFKAFNDQFGHTQGDELLKKTAQMLKNQMRETDIVGRYGGDEFLVVLPETPLSEAWIPAKRVHSFFTHNPYIIRGKNQNFNNTFSVGISGFPMKGIETIKDLINHADKGLYESKLKGGNQVIFWGE